MRKYQTVIWWSEDDQAYLAMAPELPRCIADGPTHEEALRELDVVIEHWMEWARERNQPIPEPSGKLLPVRDQFDWKPLPEITTLATTEGAAKTAPRISKKSAAKPDSLRRKKASKQPQTA